MQESDPGAEWYITMELWDKIFGKKNSFFIFM